MEDFRSTVVKSANAARAAGCKVTINWRIPTVSVEMHNDIEYFFQEYEASRLLEEADSNRDNISVEDYIMWSAQSW